MNEAHGIGLIRPNDLGSHVALGNHVARVKAFWNDANLSNPIAWYQAQFMNYNNCIVDIADGNGVAAFLYTVPGLRSQMYLAAWGRPAMRQPDLYKAAGHAAFILHDLQEIDAFVSPENKLSMAVAERCGMTRHGLIPKGTCYNGTWHPLVWWSTTREQQGLPLRECDMGVSNGR